MAHPTCPVAMRKSKDRIGDDDLMLRGELGEEETVAVTVTDNVPALALTSQALHRLRKDLCQRDLLSTGEPEWRNVAGRWKLATTGFIDRTAIFRITQSQGTVGDDFIPIGNRPMCFLIQPHGAKLWPFWSTHKYLFSLV